MKINDAILSQYEIMVNTSLEISRLRNNSNRFYLTVNTVLLAIAGYFQSSSLYVSILLCVAGIIMSAVWFQNIESYRKTNSAKFKVIHEMEKKLPYKMFAQEQAYYKKDKKKNFSNLEKKVPWLFGFLYFIFLIIIIIKI